MELEAYGSAEGPLVDSHRRSCTAQLDKHFQRDDGQSYIQ